VAEALTALRLELDGEADDVERYAGTEDMSSCEYDCLTGREGLTVMCLHVCRVSDL